MPRARARLETHCCASATISGRGPAQRMRALQQQPQASRCPAALPDTRPASPREGYCIPAKRARPVHHGSHLRLQQPHGNQGTGGARRRPPSLLPLPPSATAELVSPSVPRRAGAPRQQEQRLRGGASRALQGGRRGEWAWPGRWGGRWRSAIVTGAPPEGNECRPEPRAGANHLLFSRRHDCWKGWFQPQQTSMWPIGAATLHGRTPQRARARIQPQHLYDENSL